MAQGIQFLSPTMCYVCFPALPSLLDHPPCFCHSVRSHSGVAHLRLEDILVHLPQRDQPEVAEAQSPGSEVESRLPLVV